MIQNNNQTHIYTLITRWDDRLADNIYIFTHLAEEKNGERTVYGQEKGDLAWAQRISKHYSIQIPLEGEK